MARSDSQRLTWCVGVILPGPSRHELTQAVYVEHRQQVGADVLISHRRWAIDVTAGNKAISINVVSKMCQQI